MLTRQQWWQHPSWCVTCFRKTSNSGDARCINCLFCVWVAFFQRHAHPQWHPGWLQSTSASGNISQTASNVKDQVLVFISKERKDAQTSLIRKSDSLKSFYLFRFSQKKIFFNLFVLYWTTVDCHPAYLTHMQSTSWETLDWKIHKLESRLLGEISITSDMQMTPPLWQKVKRN